MGEGAKKIHGLPLHGFVCALVALTAGCSVPPTHKAEPPTAPVVTPEAPADTAIGSQPIAKPAPPTPTPPAAAAEYRPALWSDLPGWRDDNVAEVWNALLTSCTVLGKREFWQEVCATAGSLRDPDADAARKFMEQHLRPYQVVSVESGEEGLITGYYEPLLRGSRRQTDRFRYPLYAVPEDLIVVDLGAVYPELKSMRLRGRLEGRRLVPYPDRAQIESAQAPLRGHELAWVDDAVDLFFLHIQGSGRIALESGEAMRVGYADQNGHPYRAIGRLLVESGELELENASMQGIKAWARAHPHKLDALLNSNPSYVFFRELPATSEGPPGSLGVALTAGRSIAVDPRHVPLGAPVFVATTWPNSARALHRLMVAQDTGGAIRGPVRADFFWGHGEAAAEQAGRMKQRLRMWVLLPHGHPVSPPVATP